MRLITLFAGLYVLSAAMAMSAAATDIPFSDLASPEAREALSALHRAPPEPDARTDIEGLRRFHSDATDKLLVKMRETYSVSITPRKIGGINTQVVTPQAGVARNNTQRVLINLHGGAFTFGSGNGGLVESVPKIGRAHV